jgi:hypothetical protein
MSRSNSLLALLLVGCASPAGGGGTGGDAVGAGSGGAGGGPSGTGGGRADAAVALDAPPPVDLAPDLPSTEFCAAYAAKFCDRVASCSPPYLVWVYGTTAACAQRFELQCQAEAVAPGSGVSAAAAMTCAAALDGASCDDLMADSVPACQVKGTLPAGAACGSGSQCASGFCRTPETAFCGKCDARGAEGSSCDSDAACQFPLLCSEAGRCAAPAGEGELCNESRPCKPGPLFCGSDNTCHRPSGEGKACNRTGSAAYQPCETGLICRPTANGTCRPLRLVDPGLTCGISPTGSSVVLCNGSGSCVDDTCRLPGKDGEACTASPLGDSGGCLPPALCLGGLCKLPDPASCR